MVDKMDFPDTVEEFMEQYKVVDTDGVYMSKGSELVPIFRMRQWFEQLPSAQPEPSQVARDIATIIENEQDMMVIERNAQQWIPCSERLPEIGQSVLLSVGGMYSAEGCLREDGDWAQFRWDAIQRKDMVGAWKPLPEPYKGEQE